MMTDFRSDSLKARLNSMSATKESFVAILPSVSQLLADVDDVTSTPSSTICSKSLQQSSGLDGRYDQDFQRSGLIPWVLSLEG